MLAKDGGTLILLIPAPEGIAPDHTLLVDFGTTPGDKVLDLVTAGKVHDEVAAATYLAFDQTRKRISPSRSSRMEFRTSEARKIGITATTNFNEALRNALIRHGSNARIGVITAGRRHHGELSPERRVNNMPRFAANLTMMFNEVPFLDRFKAASDAGFKAVEFLFPYEHSPEEVAAKAKAAGVEIVLFNMPAGNWAAGERGIAGLPGREQEFREGVEKALTYAEHLGVPRLHAMAGIAPAGVDLAGVPRHTDRQPEVRREETRRTQDHAAS